MIDNILLNFLIKYCGDRFCWSIGYSRFGYECRVFPKKQDEFYPTIIKIGKDINETIEKMLEDERFKKYKR